MSQFHSTMSRRQFMKVLGLAGAGIGSAALVAPQFHDVDELISSPEALIKRPWYVKERELMNPTQDVDWGIMKRFNRMGNPQQLGGQTYYRSRADVDATYAAGKTIQAQRYANQEPGFSYKWQALMNARSNKHTSPAWSFPGLTNSKDWTKTPQQLGLPKHNGTPEENSRLLTAALRYFGSTFCGFAELDNTWRTKLIVENTSTGLANFSYSPSNPSPPESEQLFYKFENVDKPYEELHQNKDGEKAGKYVIPNKNLSLIQISTAQSPELVKCGTLGAPQGKPNGSVADNFHRNVQVRTFNFLRALGEYQCFGEGGHQTSELNWGASAVLTGISESSRNNLFTISPELGNTHCPCSILTDMPLAPSKPIDAGIWRFCHSCGICAETCPSGSICGDKQPSYEIPLKNGFKRMFSNPGPKAFWSDLAECRYYTWSQGGSSSICWTCFPVCPFSADRAASVHAFVRGTAAKTSIFNSFFANMSKTFEYGPHDPDEWWDLSLPVLCMDSTVGASKGGYKSY
ncbi:MAG: reductive dehalogenase [Dehalogenimonas sp.]